MTSTPQWWPVNLLLPGQGLPVRAELWCQEPRTTGWVCRLTVSLWRGDPPTDVRTPLLVPADAVSRVEDVDYEGVPTWTGSEGYLLQATPRNLVHHRYCPVGVADTDSVVIPDPSAWDLLDTGRATRCAACQPQPEAPTPREG